jgi:hypothetical protein
MQLADLFVWFRKVWRIPSFAPGRLALQGLTMYWPDPANPTDEAAKRKKFHIENYFYANWDVDPDGVGTG